MFDIGFSELLVIAVVALIVLGPERLPKAARFAGLWVRKARAQWYAVKSEFERDLAAEELQRSLRETRESLRQAEEQLRGGAAAFQQRIEQEFDEVKSAATALPAAAAASQSPDAHGEAGMDASHAFAEEEDRPMGSTAEIDDIGPPPTDEDDEGVDVDLVHDEHEDAHHPRKPADDAHAGR